MDIKLIQLGGFTNFVINSSVRCRRRARASSPDISVRRSLIVDELVVHATSQINSFTHPCRVQILSDYKSAVLENG